MTPFTVFAVTQNCNGVLTDKPCSELKAEPAKLSGASVAAGSAEDEQALLQAREMSRKKSAMHEITMSGIAAKRDYDVSINLRDLEKFCLQPETSLEACERAIDKEQQRLDQRTTQAAALAEKQRENKLREEANRLERERNEIEANKPTIVVTENLPYRRYPRYYDDRRYPDGDRRGEYQETVSGAGINVTASGTVNGNPVRVNAGGNIRQREGSYSDNVVVGGGTIVPPAQSGGSFARDGSNSAGIIRQQQGTGAAAGLPIVNEPSGTKKNR